MAYAVQRVAVVELGPDPGSLTDYSCDVSGFLVTVGRTSVVKAASFGSPAVEQRASAHTATVTITFTSQPHASSGLVNAMRAAQNTIAGELFFRVRYQDAAVSASNPSQSGWLLVTDVQIGAPVSEAMQQTQTFPARDVTEADS